MKHIDLTLASRQLWVVVFMCSSYVVAVHYQVAFIGTFWPVPPFKMQRIGGAVDVVVDRINADTDLFSNFTLNYTFSDTFCSAKKCLDTLVTQARDVGVAAVIGPPCTSESEVCGLLAAEWNFPMISYVARGESLSDKQKFGTYSRVVAPAGKDVAATIDWISSMGWDHVGIIYIEAIWGDIVMTSLLPGLESRNMTYYVTKYSELTVTEKIREDAILEVTAEARIIILAAVERRVRWILLKAYDLGLLDSGKYLFINIDGTRDNFKGEGWHRAPGSFGLEWDLRDADAAIAYRSLVVLDLVEYKSNEYNTFVEEVWLANMNPPWNSNLSSSALVTVDAGYLYDCFWLYALTVASMLKYGEDPYDGAAFGARMRAVNFNGMTGRVSIDANGDRNQDYVMMGFKSATETFDIIQEYDGVLSTWSYIDATRFTWPSGSSEPPIDMPECGFHGELCIEPEKDYTTIIIVSVVLLILLIAALFLGLIFYNKYKFEQELLSAQWKVDYNDIIFSKGGKSRAGSVMASMMFSRMSMATSGRASNEGQAQVFTTVGNYNSEVVAIRKVHKDAIQLDRTQLVELKVMRELRHDNINPFIGACVDTPNICILMQYCPKGSLQDVIENDAISLDWMFKMSFASDITAGLTYLHKSPLKMHGRLKSSNCLLDSRWVVRLTDSGLWTFQANQKKDKSADVGEYAVYRSKLWTAPELLRNPPPDGKGTHKGDIYSFGVVLQEIVTRREAFWNFSDIMTPKEIVDKIIEGGETPLRPDVSDDTCPAIFQSVIEKCWDEIPEHRPELGEIKRAISAANPNKTNNILDNMVAMLEKYANNLEDIVAERTAQLEVEKKKTEVLLYRMLPESVAIKLKNGEAITAESFDAVTIFFSDIVGFTALSAQSTPFQVVDLLNDLYTAFDAIIETVDVYKVETIGDAYMVVSGLPTRNGDRHAGEICTMALKLLSAVETFKIRHRPDDKLKLRIGLHTGPCVAGVVGLTMPRYCLFGDTVNTASRFESNGLPLRIHVSPTTVKLLNTLGGYNVKERGEVFMKGKGNLITYWLLGKDGYTGTLPPFDEEDPAP